MIKADQIKIDINEITDECNDILKNLSKTYRIPVKEISNLKILKKSIDARKKPQIYFVYSVAFSYPAEAALLSDRKVKNLSAYADKKYEYPSLNSKNIKRPVIIGAGPAGLFAGFALAKMGLRPIILERGKDIDTRTADVDDFWKNGKLLKDSNVLFGEGGAGTFSDGKLNTLNKDINGRNTEVLRIFTECGGPESIRYDNKPHIGTDLLKVVVKKLRNRITELGAEVRFNTKAETLIIDNGRITGVKTSNEILYTDDCILAIGHSARDTYSELKRLGIKMEAKSFAVGLRVQHSQQLINESQYGSACDNANLTNASYKLTYTSHTGRGVYSFCMCPGGYVVNSSSEDGRLSVNGMSYHDRNSSVANSAIIVSVTPDDYPGDDELSGIEFQRRLEEKAYKLGCGCIPIQYYGDFKSHINKDYNYKHIDETEALSKGRFKGAVAYSKLHELLPGSLSESFVEGMTDFGRRIKGFDNDDALLAGIESRTSSPVRINRDVNGESITGLYPCGEGAGYAGGITSAAMDGLFIAECIAKKYIRG